MAGHWAAVNHPSTPKRHPLDEVPMVSHGDIYIYINHSTRSFLFFSGLLHPRLCFHEGDHISLQVQAHTKKTSLVLVQRCTESQDPLLMHAQSPNRLSCHKICGLAMDSKHRVHHQAGLLLK